MANLVERLLICLTSILLIAEMGNLKFVTSISHFPVSNRVVIPDQSEEGSIAEPNDEISRFGSTRVMGEAVGVSKQLFRPFGASGDAEWMGQSMNTRPTSLRRNININVLSNLPFADIIRAYRGEPPANDAKFEQASRHTRTSQRQQRPTFGSFRHFTSR